MANPAKISALRNSRSEAHREKAEHGTHGKRPYRNLILMGLLHLPFMYAIMFAMVYSVGDIFHNLNTFYMAGMMVAPMLVLMPLLMGEMYPDKKLNLLTYGAAVACFAALFLFMRAQTFIGDKQFLRSMVPHHSGAVLMCEKATIKDSEIQSLCSQIIESQTREIDQMKRILERL